MDSTIKPALVILVLMVACKGLSGCGTPNYDPADTGMDGGVDGGVDGGADIGFIDSWRDPATGRIWQRVPPSGEKTWQNAVYYCNTLTLDGVRGWRLPTINELRSIIRGCAKTQMGGLCGVKDDCLTSSCSSDACNGCEEGKGPVGGCYWDSNLSGSCSHFFWSASSYAYYPINAWYVNYNTGSVNYNLKNFSDSVRCVRNNL